ncbi:T9SS type B sorting domain-containing protein [Neolewinella agarilytica]|uniref:Gliding motility-associated C-terminal domain-containing protein n=1 Tax=Neolewinella agarilytica TaxID=478744 RepID=A0A1H9EY50_9BACT|nr:gliding motility-associated C-terminal domain-containing protein [Neolewinella agarilytica]SEQ30664.1 gliding motility-associated C-terminal domain-containing protein [Neolewinella agarilytica]
MKSRYFFIAFFSLCSFVSFAQQANDECIDAIVLPEVLDFCSGNGAFSTVGASASFDQNGYDVCISEPDQMRDVWYSFVALRNSATVTVDGIIPGNQRGTLREPQMTVYENGCGSLTDADALVCKSPFENVHGVNAILTDLVVGETYLILVGARNGNDGTFELCVNQFDAVPEPNADCSTGVVLCDKSPFSVQSLSGNGLIREDLQAQGCVDNDCLPTEDNSSWYKWTCDQSGTLGFTITPLGPAVNEDIDFAVYELTNGLDDCGSRQTLRCMYSGETRGNPDSANLPCLGPTGLSLTDPDVSESCGCQTGNNNFASAINMISGRSYAVVIFNFSASGDGFSIEFEGTGTFVGPEPAFTFSSSEVCVGDALTFEDQSTSLDMIVSREWDFGPTATPQTASGPGPHSVVFGVPGSPEVSLIIETSRECREILNQQEVNVICCDGQFTGTAMTTDVLCPNDITGSINLTASSSFSPTTLSFNWDNGEMSEDLDNLAQGDYTVTVSDASGCEEAFSFSVGGPPVFTFDTLITMPDCAGGTNGALEFTVLSGGQGPYEYSLNNSPFSANNQLTDLSVGTVNVRVQDANGCPVEQDIEVNELELGLVQGVPVFTEPVCAGEATGRIEIQLANGQPAYQFDFGDGFQPSNVRSGLAAGTYPVTALDATGCRGEFEIIITEPPAITLVGDAEGSTCFGTDDGRITVLSGGGRPGYSYRWSDGSTTDSVRTDLVPGTYTISLTDQNGCVRTLTETLTEPNEIFPVLEQTNNLTCNSEPTGSFLLSATGGTPDYGYSADGQTFQTGPLLENLLAGDYRLYVQDANGCIDSLDGTLTEPREFIIDPGPERTITLGFDTILRAVSNYTPVSYVWGPDSLLCLDALCTRVRAAPVATTIYTVIGTNPAGCQDTAMVAVKVIEDKPLYIPNVFSPNGDGANDGFTVFGGRAVDQINSLRIYDRWGGLVFERNDFLPNEPSLGWDGKVDGKPVNPAVFVYYTSVRYINGSVLEFSGDVTVLR